MLKLYWDRRNLVLFIATLWWLVGNGVADRPSHDSVMAWFDQHATSMMSLYINLHQNPELSLNEESTAATIAEHWRAAGFEVTVGVGGHGIVGILNNGDGPMLMLRCDLDALPITEQTDLAYASTVQVRSDGGQMVGVMHACGHDVHMTNVTSVAQYFASNRDQWAGTIMLVGQPAEEIGAGAKAMIEDGLFERFGKPDFALAIHVASDAAASTVGYRSGYSQANVDSVDVVMRGRSGHGSKPELAIDPIMQAAEFVMSLQTIVSREVAALDPAVVTVGSIHGGSKHNIIGDQCTLQLTVRSYDAKTRVHLLDAIRRKANAVAMGSRADEPLITISQGTPSLFNDEKLSDRIVAVLKKTLGDDKVQSRPPSMGGEDFSRYGEAGVPIFMYAVGTVSPRQQRLAEQTEIPPPSLHSSKYAPDIEPTLQTAFRSMVAATLELLGR